MRMMSITILIVQVAIKMYYCRRGSGKQRGSEIDRQARGGSSIRLLGLPPEAAKPDPPNNNNNINTKQQQLCQVRTVLQSMTSTKLTALRYHHNRMQLRTII